jgi:hypothetical protein
VPYVAIDPTFPHHLNTFDNVPINYDRNLVLIILSILGEFHSKNKQNDDILEHYKLYTAGIR